MKKNKITKRQKPYQIRCAKKNAMAIKSLTPIYSKERKMTFEEMSDIVIEAGLKTIKRK